ncbi:hypothetical protein B296_00024975 [Ensete ventricosum]|uniref:CTP synthase N-terminal domain-containing protein n=1 Tax=Ensete ventricosum TaxID=4639 RepID=A0A426Z8B8_ENSVE|nr:hypothetical protein B296_00024975 [Ensete ventricosum]
MGGAPSMGGSNPDHLSVADPVRLLRQPPRSERRESGCVCVCGEALIPSSCSLLPGSCCRLAALVSCPEISRDKREMKYVLVTGGVVSGLGKGVTASSIGVILKACGLRVTTIKIGACLASSNFTVIFVRFPLERNDLFYSEEVDL